MSCTGRQRERDRERGGQRESESGRESFQLFWPKIKLKEGKGELGRREREGKRSGREGERGRMGGKDRGRERERDRRRDNSVVQLLFLDSHSH